jgi:hypothetical protein
MKKLFVWALMATLMVAGSAFAEPARQVAANATFATGSPATTNNDDSCDIGVAPAATLLLPYFEVDIASPVATAQTTLFTITNTSQVPQIAHVTLWSDWSYPVLDFNIFLTGYDVQAINLYDIIARGVIAPNGSAIGGTNNQSTPGARSLNNLTGNTNFLASAAANCSATSQPIEVGSLLPDLQSGLTTGAYSLCGTARIGGVHTNAIGYVTVDVAATCSPTLPTESTYYQNEILFDNVLIGDYQQVNPNATSGNYAQGNPMVHIRAIPEGGGVGSVPGTNLPYTFYDRYTPGTNRRIDRRQPLPSVFAARYIQGGASGFLTNFKIWREGVTGAAAQCSTYINNSRLGVVETIRFDERENPTTTAPQVIISPFNPGSFQTPEATRIASSDSRFPLLTSGDVAGWMYMNLNNNAAAGATNPYSTVRASQNWAIVSMFAEGRYSVDFDAAWLGNGCSAPALGGTNATTNPIGPRPNVTP